MNQGQARDATFEIDEDNPLARITALEARLDEAEFRITLLRKTLALLTVGVVPGIKWMDEQWKGTT